MPTPREVTLGGMRLLIALCGPAHLFAQAVGTIRGTVTATDGTPLALARISVVGTKQASVTSFDGEFQVAKIAAGLHVIHVGLVGHGAVLLPVEVQAGDTVEVRVTLAVTAVPLDTIDVSVEGAPLVAAMRGFEERRARAPGHFFNRQEIVRMQPRVFTDVLRRVPGVQVQPVRSPFEPGEAVRMARTTGLMGARPCPVLYYMNGTPFPVAGEIPINHYIAPEDVAAIEIYNGMSQIPSEFSSSSHNARCGVIVIWTLSSLDTTSAR